MHSKYDIEDLDVKSNDNRSEDDEGRESDES